MATNTTALLIQRVEASIEVRGDEMAIVTYEFDRDVGQIIQKEIVIQISEIIAAIKANQEEV